MRNLYSRKSDDSSTFEAIKLLKSALNTERENSYAWYTLSRAYGEVGMKAEAKYATAEQAYAIGDLARASSFAKRAQTDLERGDPLWRRASDIIVVSDAQLAKKNSTKSRPLNLKVSIIRTITMTFRYLWLNCKNLK